MSFDVPERGMLHRYLIKGWIFGVIAQHTGIFCLVLFFSSLLDIPCYSDIGSDFRTKQLKHLFDGIPFVYLPEECRLNSKRGSLCFDIYLRVL